MQAAKKKYTHLHWCFEDCPAALKFQDRLYQVSIRKLFDDDELFGRVIDIKLRKTTRAYSYVIEYSDRSCEHLPKEQVEARVIEPLILQLSARRVSGCLAVEASVVSGEVVAETALACGDTVGKLRRALRSMGCSAAKYLAGGEELFYDDTLLTKIPIAGTD